MSVEQSIERLSQDHEAVMWWEPDERAIVYAGSEVGEPVVSTEYTEEDALDLRRQTGNNFFDLKIRILNEAERIDDADLFGRDSQPIGILAGPGLVSGVVPFSTMEWLGKPENVSWQKLATGAKESVKIKAKQILNKLGIKSLDFQDKNK